MAKIRGFDFPEELYYLVEQDIWARPEPDGSVTVGLTTLGVHISGDFVEFIPKSIGTHIERDRAIAVLEMSKTIRSARAPAAGTIIAVNERVKQQPGMLNGDPYGEGWLVRLQPDDWAADAHTLTTGADLPPLVERYMDLYLVPVFGSDTGLKP